VLDELRIRGLGVIEEAVLPLGRGLTVLTGETGAGKTMVVTGLLLLFGGRADVARVRAGADQAVIDGRVLVPATAPVSERVRAAGGELDPADQPADGGGLAELVLRRTVQPGGRSRAYVGGAPTPIGVLAELADHLLTVHGQADQLRLVRPGRQRDLLDAYGDIDRSGFAAAYTEWRAAQDRLDDRVHRAAELRREADLLSHGIAEIDAIAPQPGEDTELARLAARLGAAEALRAAARAAHDALLGAADDLGVEYGDVTSLVGTAGRELASVRGADEELDDLAVRLTELGALAADLGADLGRYADGLDTDPAQLAGVQERRSAITALIRKYCDEPEPSVAAVLRWADAARSRLAELDVSDAALDALRDERDAAAARAAALAERISYARRAAAAKLAAAVNAELPGLALPDAEFASTVRVRPPSAGSPRLEVAGEPAGVAADGVDEVEFLFRSHPAAPALPLGRGASGGELSRLMLAVELSLAAASDPVPTMVFDEVDAGIGGRAAVEVGRRLAQVARDRQVLVVTHLAQVAAFADHHVVVRKDVADAAGIGVTDVRSLTGDERTAELARMLGGSDTTTARRHAAELLADAGVGKSDRGSRGARR
jgi:DNA repair protein RecN (Recombination protein N)